MSLTFSRVFILLNGETSFEIGCKKHLEAQKLQGVDLYIGLCYNADRLYCNNVFRRKNLIELEKIMFNEICIYEAKIEKQEEIETLMKEVAEFYLSQSGVIDVKYIKRTHRQKDFNAVKAGEPPIRLTRQVGKVTYMLYWVLENEEAHARVGKLGLEKFYKRWNRCLTTMPKILLGENIV